MLSEQREREKLAQHAAQIRVRTLPVALLSIVIMVIAVAMLLYCC